MLSISEPIKDVGTAVTYYTTSGKEGYYLDGKTKPGRWVGKAAKALGLPSEVEAKTFHNLLRGFSADGRNALVQNAGEKNRDVGWDLTYSAPKSVSVLWAMSSATNRSHIEAAHRQAVEKSLKHAEALWGFTRRGKGGKRQERAAMMFATFEEYTSRELDMNLHTHCVLINTSVRQDGTTGALHSINFFRAKMVLGSLYAVELAAQLRGLTGLVITPERVGFAIEGISKPVCRSFSKRRVAIEKAMEEKGLDGPVAAKVVTRTTRSRKQEVSMQTLTAHWHQEGRTMGFGPEQAQRLVERHNRTQSAVKPLEHGILEAIENFPEQQRSGQNLLRAIRMTAIEQGADGQAFLMALQKAQHSYGQSILWQPKHFQTKADESKNGNPTRIAEGSGKRAEESAQQSEDKRVASSFVSSIHPENAEAAVQHSAVVEKKPDLHADEHGALSFGQVETPVHNNQQSLSSQTGEAEANLKQSAPITQTKPDANSNDPKQSDQSQKQHKSDAAIGGGHSQSNDHNDNQRRHPEGEQFKVSRQQQKRNLAFERAFGERVDRIFPAKQTRERLTQLATRMADKFRADSMTLERVLDQMNPGAEQSYVHIERPRPFAKSWVSPIKWWRIPKIVIGDKSPKWGQVHWKKELVLGEIKFKDRLLTSGGGSWSLLKIELKIQDRILIPDGGRWSIFHGPRIPALRFSLKCSNWKGNIKSQSQKPSPKNATAEQKNTGNERSADQTQSQ